MPHGINCTTGEGGEIQSVTSHAVDPLLQYFSFFTLILAPFLGQYLGHRKVVIDNIRSRLFNVSSGGHTRFFLLYIFFCLSFPFKRLFLCVVVVVLLVVIFLFVRLASLCLSLFHFYCSYSFHFFQNSSSPFNIYSTPTTYPSAVTDVRAEPVDCAAASVRSLR